MGEKLEDEIKNHLSNFNTLESLMENNIHQIYKKDQEASDGYGIGWALRDSIAYPSGWGNGYLKSLELNFNSIVGKIDVNDLINFNKKLIDTFWETFSEIQTLGAICRAKKKVLIEMSLIDMDSNKKFDFKISQPDIYIEVYSPFSKELGKDYDEIPKWIDIGDELKEKIFKKYRKKEMLNIISHYPIFLVINTMRLIDADSINISEIINPTSKKYIFPINIHCHGILLYNFELKGDGINVVHKYIWNPKCPKKLKSELLQIFDKLE